MKYEAGWHWVKINGVGFTCVCLDSNKKVCKTQNGLDTLYPYKYEDGSWVECSGEYTPFVFGKMILKNQAKFSKKEAYK